MTDDRDLEPMAYSVKQTVRLTGVSRSKVYDLIREKKLRVCRFCRRTLIPRDAIKDLLR